MSCINAGQVRVQAPAVASASGLILEEHHPGATMVEILTRPTIPRKNRTMRLEPTVHLISILPRVSLTARISHLEGVNLSVVIQPLI